MSAEYGTINIQDVETPLISNQVSEDQTFFQKAKDMLYIHRCRILVSWIIIITAAFVFTLSFHLYTMDKNGDSSQDSFLEDMCISDRSWFVALMLSIFLGPLGIDRFYLGYTFLGILKFLTAGLGGVWCAVDIVLIALNVLTDHPHGCHLR